MSNVAERTLISARTLDALLEAFEVCYMPIVEHGDVPMELRDMGCYAFYAIRDHMTNLINELDKLAGHMDVCDVVNANRKAQQCAECIGCKNWIGD